MNNLETYKKDFLNYLNSTILVKEPVGLYQPIKYILEIGGKRLRPILTLMICDLYGTNYNKAFDAALAIEVFHNFTLAHDDIMDNALIRRGKETVHEKWDVNTGILSGDAMLILAYQCFESFEPELYKELMLLFNRTAMEVCEGQQWDIEFENRNNVSISEYLKMITLKTSVLLASAMKMGAIIAKVNGNELEAIYNFGLNLGIAFQLQDDYLDTFGNSKDFGKQIGGDITENKKTFLFLKTLEVAGDDEKSRLLNLYSSKKKSAQKIEEVTNIFKNNNIEQYTLNKIKFFTEKAFEYVNDLNLPDEKKTTLKNFGISLMKRSV